MQRKFFVILTIFLATIFLAVVSFYVISRKNLNFNSKTQTSVGIDVGKIAPEFTITTIDGEKIKSVDLRGKIVVLTSSVAWCPTCVMEAKEFSPVYLKYKDKPVLFITVDIDPRDSKEFIEQFKIENNTPWPYVDVRGGIDIIQKYSLNRFEITYILDKQGIIRFKDMVITTSDILDQELQKLL